MIIPAGVPRKPGMTRDDLFNTNASVVRDLVQAIGRNSPKALIGVISNPVSITESMSLYRRFSSDLRDVTSIMWEFYFR